MVSVLWILNKALVKAFFFTILPGYHPIIRPLELLLVPSSHAVSPLVKLFDGIVLILSTRTKYCQQITLKYFSCCSILNTILYGPLSASPSMWKKVVRGTSWSIGIPCIEGIASCVEPFSGFNPLFLGNSFMCEHECHQDEFNSEDAPSTTNKNLGRATPQKLAFVVGVLESLRPINLTLDSHTQCGTQVPNLGSWNWILAPPPFYWSLLASGLLPWKFLLCFLLISTSDMVVCFISLVARTVYYDICLLSLSWSCWDNFSSSLCTYVSNIFNFWVAIWNWY